EIAPLKNYRVLLQTPERDIGSVSVGQRGRLVISAFPGQSFDFHVSQVVPLAATNESGNYFQVEAKLAQATELLRPGMSGHAKVDVGDRSILWILSHRLIDNLRILAWTLGL
ncbi:MAG: HlyD family efflux transporter periplasmic adaptor subunit, partial [Granulosicoccaceae bacterium]